MPVDPFNPYEPRPTSPGLVSTASPYLPADSAGSIEPPLALGRYFYGVLSQAFILVLDPPGITEKNPKVIYLPSLQEEIPFERSAEYDRTPIAFGTENTLFYKNTSPITFELNWIYAAGVNVRNGIELMQVTQLLHSLVCPGKKPKPLGGTTEAGSSDYDRPGVVYVVIGMWLRLRCIVDTVKIVYGEPWGSPNSIDPGDMADFRDSALMPRIAKCSVSFEATQFYDAHKGVSIPNEVQSLEQAAKRLGAKGLRDRDLIRENGLSNISFHGMSDVSNIVTGTDIVR